MPDEHGIPLKGSDPFSPFLVFTICAVSDAVYRKFPYITFLLLVLVAGCSKEIVLIKPKLTLTSRANISLAQPVAIRVVDDEAGGRGVKYSAKLLKAICNAYPHSFKAVSPDSIAVHDRVVINIYIRQLGAYFNRTKKSVLGSRAYRVINKKNIAGWGRVIAAAQATQPVVSGTVFKYLPGNWSGIAHIDVEVRDRRPGHFASFTISIAAERSGGNDLGYARATFLASDAWNSVGPRLAAVLHAANQKVAGDVPATSKAIRRSRTCNSIR